MALIAQDISFGYSRRRPVLRSVSLTLEPGAITAIAGPNGAGKSTLLRLLLGLEHPWSGSITLDGRRISGLGHAARARRMAYVPQRTSLAFAFTVRQFVALGTFAAGAPAQDSSLVVKSAMARADIADRADDPFPILSAGQQQRATLARALAQLNASPAAHTGARILLADEPVSAMDPRHALQTMGILRELAAAGVAIAVVLHDLTLAARFCDRALLLSAQGGPVAAGPLHEALDPAILARVFDVPFTRLAAPDGGPVLLPAAGAP